MGRPSSYSPNAMSMKVLQLRAQMAIMIGCVSIFPTYALGGELNDCVGTIDTRVGENLTEKEELDLLNQRFFDALVRFEECLKPNSSSVDGQTTQSTGGGAASAAVESASAADVQAVERPEPETPADEDIDDLTLGMTPEEIEAADNEIILIQQIHRAATIEQDPIQKEKLWQEYRKRKSALKGSDRGSQSPDSNQVQSFANALPDKPDVTKLDFSVAAVSPTSDFRKQGSGFVVAPGRLITNAHVVGGSSTAWLWFRDERRPIEARVLRINKTRDVALLQFDQSYNRPALSIREEPIERGDEVWSFGAPHGMLGTIQQGFVSYTNQFANGLDYILSSAVINPGSSGGPLVDRNTSVVGIAVMGPTSQLHEGQYFFIPIEDGLRAAGM